jgi:hypothetical protein
MPENPITPYLDLDDIPEDDFEEQPSTPDPWYAMISGPPCGCGMPKLSVFGKDK